MQGGGSTEDSCDSSGTLRLVELNKEIPSNQDLDFQTWLAMVWMLSAREGSGQAGQLCSQGLCGLGGEGKERKGEGREGRREEGL